MIVGQTAMTCRLPNNQTLTSLRHPFQNWRLAACGNPMQTVLTNQEVYIRFYWFGLEVIHDFINFSNGQTLTSIIECSWSLKNIAITITTRRKNIIKKERTTISPRFGYTSSGVYFRHICTKLFRRITLQQ